MTVRDRRVIAVVVGLIVILAAWFVVIQPKRSQASKLGTQIAAAQQKLSAANSAVAVAEADKRAYKADYASVAKLGEAVPTDDDDASLLVELDGAAAKAGVKFGSVVLNPSSGSSSTSTASSTSTSTSTTGSTSAAATLPPGATVGPAGFPVMPFTFTFVGSFFKLANFVDHLQRFVVVRKNAIEVSGRLMTLNSISLEPSSTGFPQIVATISATTYLEPSGTPSSTTTTATPTTTSTTPTASATSAGNTTPTTTPTTSPVSSTTTTTPATP